MQQRTKKIVTIAAAAVVAIAVLVVGGSWVYVEFIKDDPPAALGEDDLDAALGTNPASPTSTAAASSTTQASSTASGGTTSTSGASTTAVAPAAGSVDGDWNITTESVLRYRVAENINGFDTEGVGQTNQVTGVLTLSGTTATAADFVVDMTTFKSDEERRDGQFNGRIMSVEEFPTSEFHLTSPIDFGSVPAEGQSITASATGDLTLRGVTRSVTFELTARLENGRIGVLGAIPVVFADYGIPNPSFATITTEDNGLLEFVLVFEKA